MKISILSMQKVNNFGSLLQAYSLKKLLAKNSVSFIDIKKISTNSELIKKHQIKFVEEKESFCSKKLFDKLSKLDQYCINRIKIKKNAKRQNLEFEKFRCEYLNIKSADNLKKYDLCIIGSDEVFNCLTGAKWGFTSQLFGNVEQADNVITYAASCGATKFEDVPVAAAEVIKKSFERVSDFSVRDNNTKEFVQKLTQKEVHNHLDPVLVGDFSEEMSNVKEIKNLPERYCIVYSYYNRIHKKEEIKAIKKFCKDKKLEIVAIGAPQMWIKNYVVLEPFEMLVAFQNADFIITDTFHGTIFSAKYNGKFATMIRESNRNKLMDLINRIKVSEHMISDFSELENAWNAENSVERVNELIKSEREKTLKYFDDCFEKLGYSKRDL